VDSREIGFVVGRWAVTFGDNGGFDEVRVHSDITVSLRENEDERRPIGAYVIVAVTRIEANDFEVGIGVVHFDTMIDEVLVVESVAVCKRNCHAMS
jgi:hypothetical protein